MRNQNFSLAHSIISLYYIQVNLQFAAKINMSALCQAVEGKKRLSTQQPIAVLNIVMHYAATI